MTTLHYGRKADANMWWIIIGAVIALVVLIIMMVIFTGKSGKLEGGLLDCESKGGECIPLGSDCRNLKDGTSGTISSAFDCSASKRGTVNGVCCFGSKK